MSDIDAAIDEHVVAKYGEDGEPFGRYEFDARAYGDGFEDGAKWQRERGTTLDKLQVTRLLSITGHRTSAYGQGSYDGDYCTQCGWQGGCNSGSGHTADTRRAAVVAAPTTFGIEVHDA
jgi:hypothetical protein